MSEYYITEVSIEDANRLQQIDQLLEREGIRRDANLDYICAMYDEEQNLIATGSCYGNTLRCMAVRSSHQGEGLMNQIVTYLLEVQFERGNSHLFLYTKCESAAFFAQLGFYEIVRVDDQIVFMENKKNGFNTYLKKLKECAPKAKSVAAIVMNANPFTLGHQYLVEKAASENEIVHLFVVSEEQSIVPFDVRKRLVLEGTRHLSNVCYHDTGFYMISNNTFPSYFQRDQEAVIESHARLDLAIFLKIAQEMQITCRYVGEEPFSIVTGIYNRIMEQELSKEGIVCHIIKRKMVNHSAISASHVRKALKDDDYKKLKQMVPDSTLQYFTSLEAEPVIQRIKNEEMVVHY